MFLSVGWAWWFDSYSCSPCGRGWAGPVRWCPWGTCNFSLRTSPSRRWFASLTLRVASYRKWKERPTWISFPTCLRFTPSDRRLICGRLLTSYWVPASETPKFPSWTGSHSRRGWICSKCHLCIWGHLLRYRCWCCRSSYRSASGCTRPQVWSGPRPRSEGRGILATSKQKYRSFNSPWLLGASWRFFLTLARCRGRSVSCTFGTFRRESWRRSRICRE